MWLYHFHGCGTWEPLTECPQRHQLLTAGKTWEHRGKHVYWFSIYAVLWDHLPHETKANYHRKNEHLSISLCGRAIELFWQGFPVSLKYCLWNCKNSIIESHSSHRFKENHTSLTDVFSKHILSLIFRIKKLAGSTRKFYY